MPASPHFNLIKQHYFVAMHRGKTINGKIYGAIKGILYFSIPSYPPLNAKSEKNILPFNMQAI